MPIGVYLHKKGYKRSKEICEKINKSLTGKPLSDAHRLKISLIQKGKKRKPCPPEVRRKISESQKGSKARNWKGGISPKNEIIRKSVEYKLWRDAVFKRDNYQCIWGGKAHGNRLHADHIKPFALYPELRFAIDNGITLSEKAHKEFHKKYGVKNNTKEQLIEFLN
jgi:5-methylcytosine-specific restriction endonuclease McrA